MGKDHTNETPLSLSLYLSFPFQFAHIGTNVFFSHEICSIRMCLQLVNFLNSSIEHSRRRRYNRHDSSEHRHATNGNGTTARAGSITNSTSASKRQKKNENLLNNNKNHVTSHYHTNRSTSTPNRRVSLFQTSSQVHYGHFHPCGRITHIFHL